MVITKKIGINSVSKSKKTMIRPKTSITADETHYEVLSSPEDSTHDEIRGCYRSAILNCHPDKSRSESEDRFLKVQKAWEVLGNPTSRALYDSRLRASRRDDDDDAFGGADDDVRLEDMEVVEDCGDEIQLCRECRCGDCFGVDSTELERMGYELTRNEKKEVRVRVRVRDAIAFSTPASVVLPCGSCSLKIRLFIH